jgi:hypothetical protein
MRKRGQAKGGRRQENKETGGRLFSLSLKVEAKFLSIEE